MQLAFGGSTVHTQLAFGGPTVHTQLSSYLSRDGWLIQMVGLYVCHTMTSVWQPGYCGTKPTFTLWYCGCLLRYWPAYCMSWWICSSRLRQWLVYSIRTLLWIFPWKSMLCLFVCFYGLLACAAMAQTNHKLPTCCLGSLCFVCLFVFLACWHVQQWHRQIINFQHATFK